MRFALILLLVAPIGCTTLPQPARQRFEINAISGTANSDSRNTHQRQVGGGTRWTYNNGEGLIAQAQATYLSSTDLAIEPRLRETQSLLGVGAGGGRIGRLTSIEGGFGIVNGDPETFAPWLRMTVGSMRVLRIGVTLGADDPLFLANFAHLHAHVLLHDSGLPIELQLGLASANRYLLIEGRADLFETGDQLERSDSSDGDRAGTVLTGEVVWRGPIIGLRGQFALGDVDVAQLGVFYDFE